MKKKKILSMLTALAMIVTLLPALTLPAYADYTAANTMTQLYAAVVTSSGIAPTEGVYSISSDTELIYLAEYTNAGKDTSGLTFYLTDDIVLNDDASEYESWGESAPANTWTPIGTDSHNFSGTFDGDGHTVSGIYINTTDPHQGLFGYILTGAVENVGVTGSYISGGSCIGGIVGLANLGSTFDNCYYTGSVSGSSYVGGIGGQIASTGTSSTVTSCYNTGSVSGGGDFVGGLAGYNSLGSIRSCYNAGGVSGSSNYVGDVLGGCSMMGSVTSCYYDKQMCICGDTSGAVGKLTSEMMSGTALTGLDASIWTYTSGLYPRLAEMDTTDAAYISASPVKLYTDETDTTNYETVDSVERFFALTDFTVSLENGVELSSSDNCLSIDGDGNVSIIESSEAGVTLTATLNGVSKSVKLLTVIKKLYVVDASQEYDAETNPIAISSAADLKYLARQVNGGGTITYTDGSGSGSVTASTASYKQTADIVLGYWQDAGDGTVEDGEIYDSATGGTPCSESNWTPIGIYADYGAVNTPFSGSFDGGIYDETGNLTGIHTVSGLYISDHTDPSPSACPSYKGLFGYVYYGTIENAGVTDSYIAGIRSVGSIAGYLTHSTMSNCYNTSSVTSNSATGGVVGDNYNSSTIEYCYNTGSVAGSVTGNDSYVCVGGVAGDNYSGSTVEYCYNIGSVTCSVTGSDDNIGGVVGYNNSTIEYCCNAGSISGSDYIGGVAGYNEDSSSKVADCYNTGSVTGSVTGSGDNVGGVVGYLTSGAVTNNYYDKQMCTVGGINGSDADGSAVGKLTSKMVGDLFSDTTNWVTDDSLYPRLAETDTTDAAYVYASPVFLQDEETVDTVITDFTVSTENGVTWGDFF